MRSPLLIIPALTLAVAPFAVFAQTPAPAGTADYLLSTLPNASQVLAQPLVTEARMPFPIATTLSVDDPTGDVVTQYGTTSNIHETWADLTNVTWKKEASAWLVTGTVGGVIPVNPLEQVQFAVYADVDGNPDNNMPSPGIRGDMDSVWSIKYDNKYGWGVDFQWYNPAPTAKVWAQNKKTAAFPTISGSTFSLKIPFAELPSTWSPRWRVFVALANNQDESVDVVPGIGFPAANPNDKPPTGSAPTPVPPVVQTSPVSSTPWAGIAVVIIVAVAAGIAAFAFNRKPEEK